MNLSLFVDGDQVYVACADCCRAFRGVRQPLDCSADEEALLLLDLASATWCELCEQSWECAFPRSVVAGSEPAATADF